MSRAYLLRRTLIAIPSLLGISIIIFSILAAAPGDPFGQLVTNPNVPPAVIAKLRASLGLNQPIWLRYIHWLVAMLHGEWGFSFASRMDVATLIMQRLSVTIAVLGSAEVLAILIAVPVGILAAVKPYSLFDQIASTAAYIGVAMPTFFTGLLLIFLFSVRLHLLPFVFQDHIAGSGLVWLGAEIKQSAMPVAVLALFQGAPLVRFVRSSMLDVIRLDYVTTARAKGIGRRRVLLRHVVRNGLIPVVTLVALQLPGVFGGAIITEQIFRVPGMGSLLISALLDNDTPVIMAITFVFAILVIVFNLIADLLYGWLDPRINLR